jgi:hypothetical protein
LALQVAQLLRVHVRFAGTAAAGDADAAARAECERRIYVGESRIPSPESRD